MMSTTRQLRYLATMMI
uniref:Uncharacterized protein n=1 Tax=Rhizophora mucronata TaxID=61149 RepID=A0A2P2QX86_RHIMU